MKTLSQHLEDYLRLRRALGYKMQDGEKMIRNFVRFAGQEGAKIITTKLALRWAAQPNIKRPRSANRLGMARRFAAYVSTCDKRTEVPAQKLLPYRFSRRDPYHYTNENVLLLVKQARRIDPSNPIKGPALGTLLGLLAATGMRVSEALALDCGDVDWKRGLLTIRFAKGNNSRMIPLHASTLSALRQYASPSQAIGMLFAC